MKVVRLAVGECWTVLVVCHSNGSCPVLDFVNDLDGEKLRNKVLSDLQQWVPNSQTTDWVRQDFSYPFTDSDGIFEFRWPKKKGGTPRILWFYDVNRVVVCSHGLNKKGNMDNAEIERAEDVQRAYKAAVQARKLEIIDYEDFDVDELGAFDG